MKLQEFSSRFQTGESILSVNKREITAENAFHGDVFEIENNHDSSKDENALFQAFLQICYSCFNP